MYVGAWQELRLSRALSDHTQLIEHSLEQQARLHRQQQQIDALRLGLPPPPEADEYQVAPRGSRLPLNATQLPSVQHQIALRQSIQNGSTQSLHHRPASTHSSSYRHMPPSNAASLSTLDNTLNSSASRLSHTHTHTRELTASPSSTSQFSFRSNTSTASHRLAAHPTPADIIDRLNSSTLHSPSRRRRTPVPKPVIVNERQAVAAHKARIAHFRSLYQLDERRRQDESDARVQTRRVQSNDNDDKNEGWTRSRPDSRDVYTNHSLYRNTAQAMHSSPMHGVSISLPVPVPVPVTAIAKSNSILNQSDSRTALQRHNRDSEHAASASAASGSMSAVNMTPRLHQRNDSQSSFTLPHISRKSSRAGLHSSSSHRHRLGSASSMNGTDRDHEVNELLNWTQELDFDMQQPISETEW